MRRPRDALVVWPAMIGWDPRLLVRASSWLAVAARLKRCACAVRLKSELSGDYCRERSIRRVRVFVVWRSFVALLGNWSDWRSVKLDVWLRSCGHCWEVNIYSVRCSSWSSSAVDFWGRLFWWVHHYGHVLFCVFDIFVYWYSCCVTCLYCISIVYVYKLHDVFDGSGCAKLRHFM